MRRINTYTRHFSFFEQGEVHVAMHSEGCGGGGGGENVRGGVMSECKIDGAVFCQTVYLLVPIK
jgi:hypothetical protein